MAAPDRYVLYVHPYNHVVDELVPMGAVSLMNRLSVPKQGRYAYEVTEEDIAGAGCVALDLHWYFSIEGVYWIASDIKRMNPQAPIILGGITASFYAEYLIEKFPVDYVVAGDAEHSFPRLVEAVLAGGRVPDLPNVWTKRGVEPSTRRIDVAEYDDNDYLTLSWFPTLETHTHAMHAEYDRAPFWGRMDRYHPYLPLNRGCRFPCGGCFGSYQRDVFGSGQVDRSAQSLGRTLDAVEAHEHYRFVTLTGGTEDIARFDAYESVLSRKRAVGAYLMHFCDLPTDEILHTLLNGFERLCVDFTNPSDVPLPLRAKDISIDAAEARILEIAKLLDGRADCQMGISFISTEQSPFKQRLLAADFQSVSLKENSEWDLPRPNLATLPAADQPGLVQLREAKRHGKAKQAEGFRRVSEGHANYLLARALSPSLYPVLDQSYLQWVDGNPKTAIEPDHEELQAFQLWYVEEFRKWFVTTLPRVAVNVRWVKCAPDAREPGLQSLDTMHWVGDAMAAHVSRRHDGVRVGWNGPGPSTSGLGLAVMPRLGWDGDRWLDPERIGGLDAWVVPAVEQRIDGEWSLDVRISQQVCRIGLHRDGECMSETRWNFDELLPATDLLPMASTATPSGWGPVDLGAAPFADRRMPRMVRRVLEKAMERNSLGWAGELIEESERWICYRFKLDGEELLTFIMPSGAKQHYCQTRHFSMVYQEARDGLAESPRGRQLLSRVARLLRLLDSSLPAAITYAR